MNDLTSSQATTKRIQELEATVQRLEQELLSHKQKFYAYQETHIGIMKEQSGLETKFHRTYSEQMNQVQSQLRYALPTLATLEGRVINLADQLIPNLMTTILNGNKKFETQLAEMQEKVIKLASEQTQLNDDHNETLSKMTQLSTKVDTMVLERQLPPSKPSVTNAQSVYGVIFGSGQSPEGQNSASDNRNSVIIDNNTEEESKQKEYGAQLYQTGAAMNEDLANRLQQLNNRFSAPTSNASTPLMTAYTSGSDGYKQDMASIYKNQQKQQTLLLNAQGEGVSSLPSVGQDIVQVHTQSIISTNLQQMRQHQRSVKVEPTEQQQQQQPLSDSQFQVEVLPLDQPSQLNLLRQQNGAPESQTIVNVDTQNTREAIPENEAEIIDDDDDILMKEQTNKETNSSQAFHSPSDQIPKKGDQSTAQANISLPPSSSQLPPSKGTKPPQPINSASPPSHTTKPNKRH